MCHFYLRFFYILKFFDCSQLLKVYDNLSKIVQKSIFNFEGSKDFTELQLKFNNGLEIWD